MGLGFSEVYNSIIIIPIGARALIMNDYEYVRFGSL